MQINYSCVKSHALFVLAHFCCKNPNIFWIVINLNSFRVIRSYSRPHSLFPYFSVFIQKRSTVFHEFEQRVQQSFTVILASKEGTDILFTFSIYIKF